MYAQFTGIERRISIAVCVLAGLSLLLQPDAYAKSRLKPSLKVTAGQSSNIDLKEHDEKSSFVLRVEPGIKLMLPFEKAYGEIDYRFGYVSADKQDDTDTHQLRGVARYNFSQATSIGVSQGYQKSEIAAPGGDTYELDTTSASLKRQFGSNLVTTFNYSKEGFEDPSSDRFSNYDEEAFGVGIEYRFSPKLTGTVGYSSGERDFEKDMGLTEDNVKDYDVSSYAVGLRRRIGEKYTVRGVVGQTERDYKTGNDIDETIYSIGVMRKLKRLGNLDLSYAHSVEDTFYSKAPPESIYERSMSVLSNIDRNYKYMKSDRIGAIWAYNLSEKHTLSFGSAYQKNESNLSESLHITGLGQTEIPNDLDEKEYMTGAGYTRHITKNLATTFRYVYGNRDSNVRDDYDYSFVAVDMNLSF